MWELLGTRRTLETEFEDGVWDGNVGEREREEDGEWDRGLPLERQIGCACRRFPCYDQGTSRMDASIFGLDRRSR